MKSQEPYQSRRQALVDLVGERETASINVLLNEFLDHKGGPLDEGGREKALFELFDRLLDGEPVQYIIQKAWFYGLELKIDKRALIPRPETEELVYWVEKDLKKEGFESPEILDIGTGSGCIPLALKSVFPEAKLLACDLSVEALDLARENAVMLAQKVEFFKADFSVLEDFSTLEKLDIVISNPPYIDPSEANVMSHGTSRYEPEMALFVKGVDPIEPYKAIVELCKVILKSNGYIYLEINEFRKIELKEYLDSESLYFEFQKDMQGKERMLKIWNIS